MMNTQQDQNNETLSDHAGSGPVLSVGKTLREARERLGLSVNDVVNRIKFAQKQIEWLEADDYVCLPEAAFVRGFVRSYARLLELDPASLLANLPASHAQPPSSNEVKSVNIPLPSTLSARRHNIIWLAAALIIALSLAIFERMHGRAPEVAKAEDKTTVQSVDLPSGSANEPPKEAAQDGMLPQPAVSPETDQTVSGQSVRAAPVAVPSQPIPRSTQVAPQPLPPKQVERVAKTEASTASVPATVGKTEADSAVHSLRLEFDEEAWAEVKDGNDQVLTSRMHTAGSLVRVTGKAPLLVTIGNARAVHLFDNGKKVDLERYTTADVAKVKLK